MVHFSQWVVSIFYGCLFVLLNRRQIAARYSNEQDTMMLPPTTWLAAIIQRPLPAYSPGSHLRPLLSIHCRFMNVPGMQIPLPGVAFPNKPLKSSTTKPHSLLLTEASFRPGPAECSGCLLSLPRTRKVFSVFFPFWRPCGDLESKSHLPGVAKLTGWAAKIKPCSFSCKQHLHLIIVPAYLWEIIPNFPLQEIAPSSENL